MIVSPLVPAGVQPPSGGNTGIVPPWLRDDNWVILPVPGPILEDDVYLPVEPDTGGEFKILPYPNI